jgi:hypothetical protein
MIQGVSILKFNQIELYDAGYIRLDRSQAASKQRFGFMLITGF